jgi:hypothetical protein
MNFFLPSQTDPDEAIEQRYSEFRAQAEACTGSTSRDRRIMEIECRRDGHDCLLRVGDRDGVDGRTIAAILQLGRDTYTVHHVPSDPAELTAPTVLRRNDVYSVADFD